MQEPAAEPDCDLKLLARSMPTPQVARRWQVYVERHLDEFAAKMRSLPIEPDAGSMSTAEAFWLFRLGRELRPPMIIESGTATGWSTFVLAAACPSTPILSFDPFRSPTQLPPLASYHDCDWMDMRREVAPGSLALFDDHVNQRVRAIQAQRLAVSDAVFHDVYPVLTKSTVSLRFADLLGVAESVHTFDPLWWASPMFNDDTTNPQRYRWLTWLRLAPRRQLGRGSLLRLRQRRRLRNPSAEPHSRRNWVAR